MRVEELMTEKPEMLRLRDTAADAATRMRDGDIGFTPVEEVMTVDVISCSPDDDVDRAEELMRANQKARLVVIDEGGQPVGVISVADIAQYQDSSRAGDVVGDITEREAHPHPLVGCSGGNPRCGASRAIRSSKPPLRRCW